MSKPQSRSKRKRTPSAFGMGLISLDVILDPGGAEILQTGGTTGNVMAILAYLGWSTYPIARLGAGPARDLVTADLARWGVNLDYVSLRPTASTPVIVERLSKDSSGVPLHTFSFACPGCGGRLPAFQPVVLQSLEAPGAALRRAQVLFLDRVSPSAVELAKRAKEAGAVVYFEPTSVRDEKLFKKIIELADIVKYAQDRILDLNEVCDPANVWLEVQTLGRGGLRFRMPHSRDSQHWRVAAAIPVEQMQDSAGSGDWLSAVLINFLCRSGSKEMVRLSSTDVNVGLNVAQFMAAWNCQFVGPRGGMYQRPRTEVIQILRNAAKGMLALPRAEHQLGTREAAEKHGFCAMCRPESPGERPERRKLVDKALM